MSSLLVISAEGLVDSDGHPNPGFYREKLDINGLQLFRNNPKPVRNRIRERGPRMPYEHGVRSLVTNLKKLLAEDEPEKAGGKI
jgi:hypothetical protein